ncbi:ABC transporter permease [Aquabacter spiritensis]|uniref:NitT/TauT family transport system permease protein/taurine transport system permease protein n=1 Tax=Aquabacter spiritensis TaxID=933073 RepID=A0A4R3LSV1_9HYPH|nr:ABC transporter permease [Aquabacter spiritensis]TCT03600.1 NitT/TauT family transport system permease protein/taurine transport system permease protein [Aquabacter spiritensis]
MSMEQVKIEASAPAAASRPRRRRSQRLAERTLALAGFFAAWQLIAMSGAFTPVLLPSPMAVLQAGWEMLLSGALLPHIAASLARVCQGFVLATLIAVPLGIATGWSARTGNFIEPIVELFRPIPVLAILPLAILWFGIGEASKIFLITYGSFFPIFINTIAGVRFVDPVYVQAAESLGATRMQIFRRVVLMAAMPDIVVGLRLGLGFAFLTLVAAEMIASTRGIGYLIVDTQLTFQTDRTMVAMLLFGFLGFFMSMLLLLIERRLLKWKRGLASRH